MGDFSVRISSRLIDQLTDETEKVKRKPKKTKPKIPPQPKLDQKQISDDLANQKSSSGWPIQPPVFLPIPPPAQHTFANAELEAIKSVLKESEKVLEKLEKGEKNLEQEVSERAKDLRDKEFKLPSPRPMPCSLENNAWMSCYKENINDPLKCAGFAHRFADCARRVRQQMSSTEK